VEAIPDSYKDFQRLGLRIIKPLEVPSSFSDLPENISLGIFKTFVNLLSICWKVMYQSDF
jgi:hypothetical protein